MDRIEIDAKVVEALTGAYQDEINHDRGLTISRIASKAGLLDERIVRNAVARLHRRGTIRTVRGYAGRGQRLWALTSEVEAVLKNRRERAHRRNLDRARALAGAALGPNAKISDAAVLRVLDTLRDQGLIKSS